MLKVVTVLALDKPSKEVRLQSLLKMKRKKKNQHN